LLPVSGIDLMVREPTGQDELYVVETDLAPVPALLGLAARVARTAAGAEVDWTGLPASDAGAVALTIRQAWLGDAISTDTRCPQPACGERIDVAFGIDDYLRHHSPRQPRGVTTSGVTTSGVTTSGAADPGWFALTGADVRFRIPTVGDVIAAWYQSEPDAALLGRCVEPAEISRAVARRLDRALSAIAPSLSDLVGGCCPACGHEVALRFDPVSYTLADLRNAFAGLHWQTHAIAAAYGWPEEAILALPRRRRARYASIIADERSVA
jgi:hypothetical protein